MREENACPSLLAELAAALRVGWVVVFKAYWDESWRERSGVFSIAGYGFTPANSERFSTRWKRALDGAGLERFHMKDFNARKHADPPNEYSTWSDNDAFKFYRELTKIIRATASFHVAICVSLDDLKSLSEGDKEVMKDMTEWTIGAEWFKEGVEYFLGRNEPVAYIYDAVPKGKGQTRTVKEFMHALKVSGDIAKGSTLAPGSSLVHPELQAADILAHENAREYERLRYRPHDKMRTEFRKIRNALDSIRRYHFSFEQPYLGLLLSYMRANGGLDSLESLDKRPKKYVRVPLIRPPDFDVRVAAAFDPAPPSKRRAKPLLTSGNAETRPSHPPAPAARS
jgi:hypothetical protein